jgi:magnesium chelatase subunit D
MGPGAEQVSEGARMRRVDHPGSPGAEAVSVAGGPGGPIEDPDPGLVDGEEWGGEGGNAVPRMVTDVPLFELELPRGLTLGPGQGGRSRSRRRVGSSRGPTAGAAPVRGAPRDIAWEATLRSVAHQQRHRGNQGLAFSVRLDELLQHKRVRPPDHLLLLVVDASGSMAGELTAVARRIVEAALRNAYVDRQRVAMIAFRARGAELLFGPTSRVEQARTAMSRLLLGGATPLGRGLDLAHQTLRRAAARGEYGGATLLVISDGDANVGNRHGYGSAFLDVEQASRKLITVPNTEIVLLDTTAAGKDDRPARWLVEQLRARHVRLRAARKGPG